MIHNEQQFQNTQTKLDELRQHYAARKQDPPSHARDLALRSLRQTINELTEEIAWYEAHRNEPAHSTDED